MPQSKKYALKRSQPGACVTTSTTTTRNAIVETTAIATVRPSPVRTVAPPRILERRSPFRPLLQVRRAGPREPGLLELLDRPVPPEAIQGLVDARRQRVPLLQHEPESLLRTPRRELADDLPIRDLNGGDVERGREVHDDAVDLAVLERLHGQVVGVVHERPRARLDVLDDVEAPAVL